MSLDEPDPSFAESPPRIEPEELEEFIGRVGQELMRRLSFLWRLFEQGSRRPETRITEKDTRRFDTRCFHRDLDTGNGNVRYRLERRNIGWIASWNIPNIVYHVTMQKMAGAPCDIDITVHVKENSDTGKIVAICGFTIVYPPLWPTPQSFEMRSTYAVDDRRQCEDVMPQFLRALDERIAALIEVLPEESVHPHGEDFSNPPPPAS